MTAVTVAVGTLLALFGPLLREATEIGDTYVTMNSELVVLAGTNTGVDLSELSTALASVEGVDLVRPATSDDLEALAPAQVIRFSEGETLVIEPTGRVPIQAIHQRALNVSGVTAIAPGVGVPSQLTIDLVQSLVPWLAAAFFAAALILIVVLTVQIARSRADEAEAMRLVGGSTISILVRTSLVIAVPTFIAVTATTIAVIITAQSLTSWALPTGVTLVDPTRLIASTGLLLAVSAMVVVAGASLASIWRPATK